MRTQRPETKTRPRPLFSDAAIKRAQKAATAINDALDLILAQPCPKCGYLTLTSETSDSQFGITIYCDRAICSWKPWSKPKNPYPELNKLNTT